MNSHENFSPLMQSIYKIDRAIVREILNTDLNRPCIKYGSLKPSEYLLMYGNRAIGSLIDGLAEGRFMEADNPDFEQRMVPQTQDQLNMVLFDGLGSYDTLYKTVRGQVQRYANDFYRHRLDPYHSWGRYDEAESGFNPDSVLSVMEFTRDTYDGQTRRTGEPSLSHELRIMRRTLHRVEEHMRLFNQEGVDSFPYTGKGVELLLLSVLLHDFVEKEKGKSPGGYEYRNVRGGETKESILRVFQNLGDGSRGESMDIPMNSMDFTFFDRAIAELDSGDAQYQAGVHTLVEREKTKNTLTAVLPLQRLIQEIAQEVKLEDRYDNMMTYPFVLIPGKEPCKVGSYKVNDPIKIKNKALETLDNFTFLENSGVWHRSPIHKGERAYHNTIGRLSKGAYSCLYNPGCDQPHLKTIQPCVTAVKLLVGVAGHGLSEEIKNQKVVTLF